MTRYFSHMKLETKRLGAMVIDLVTAMPVVLKTDSKSQITLTWGTQFSHGKCEVGCEALFFLQTFEHYAPNSGTSVM